MLYQKIIIYFFIKKPIVFSKILLEVFILLFYIILYCVVIIGITCKKFCYNV